MKTLPSITFTLFLIIMALAFLPGCASTSDSSDSGSSSAPEEQTDGDDGGRQTCLSGDGYCDQDCGFIDLDCK